MSAKASFEFSAHDQLWIAECPQTTPVGDLTAECDATWKPTSC